MLKKSKLTLLGIICVTLLIVAVNIGLKNYDKTIKSSAVKVSITSPDKIKQLSKKQILEEAKYIANSMKNASDALMPYAVELFNRKNEFENAEIIKIISDKTNPIIIQEMMVDLYTSKNETNTNKDEKDELIKLLKQNIPKEVKVKIIANTTFTEIDVDLLKSLTTQNDDIAFQALKKLSKVNSTEAYAISENILANYKTQSTTKVSAAIKATVQYLKDNKMVNKDKFISLCSNIINNTKDAKLKNSSVFAISDLMDKQSIIEIIKNKSIDTGSKIFSIDQNFKILNEILLNNPSETDIEVVVTAMEIMPILDLIEPLEKVKKNINNKNLAKRCEDVLATMKLKGNKGNQKY